MKYYKLFYSVEEAAENNYIVSRKILNYDSEYYTPLERAVCCGNVIKNWNPETTLVCEDETQTTVPDILIVAEFWIVVSKRFVDVVAPFVKDEIQYLPLKLKAVQPQMQNEEFFVANIIKNLDALDLENCLFIGEEDPYIYRYAFKGSAIKNHHIFKDNKKISCFGNFVSEDVKNAIEAAGLKGFRFSDVKIT